MSKVWPIHKEESAGQRGAGDDDEEEEGGRRQLSSLSGRGRARILGTATVILIPY